MKIEKISKIENFPPFLKLGRVEQDFARYNLIFGWNGMGKTTLSNIFRNIERKEPITNGIVILSINGNDVNLSNITSNSILPNIRVFNRDFVAANVFKADGPTPIFVLGEENIEQEKKLQELKSGVSNKKIKHDDIVKKRNIANKDLNDFKVDKAKHIKDMLARGTGDYYYSYNTTKFTLSCDNINLSKEKLLPKDWEDCNSKINSTAKENISQIQPSPINITRAREEIDKISQSSLARKTIDSLEEDHNISEWVRNGIAHHKDKIKCYFCDNEIKQERIELLGEYFNNAFNELTSKIEKYLDKLRTYKLEFDNPRLPDKGLFHDHLSKDYSNAVHEFNIQRDRHVEFIQVLIDILEKKKGQPVLPVAFPQDLSLPSSEAMGNAIDGINKIIESHNNYTANLKIEIANAKKMLERHIISECIDDYSNKKQTLDQLSKDEDAIKQGISAITKNITSLENSIKSHHRPAQEINKKLQHYLGRDELHFETKDNGYVIKRGDNEADKLSEGEKTAIAFVYFLVSLKDKSFSKKDGIIVIDDPVSSLDSNALFNAYSFMKHEIKDASQIFILTHNLTFFRDVKHWFNNMNKQKEREAKEKRDEYISVARFFMLAKYQVDKNGSSSTIIELDKLMLNYDSDYHYMFKLVKDAMKQNANSSYAELYSTANIARRLLEGFFAFKYPDNINGFSSNMERINFDSMKKDAILSFVHPYSHNKNISEPGFGQKQLESAPGIMKYVMEIIESIDKLHYDNMMKITK